MVFPLPSVPGRRLKMLLADLADAHKARLLSLCLLVTLFSSLAVGQIPFTGFENWETDPDSNFNPQGWQTTNSFPLVNVERYAPGYHGNYAMKVKTLNPGFPFPGVATLQVPYNFSQIPTRLSAWIKSTLMPGDHAYFIVALMRGDSVIASPGDCTYRIDTTFSQFTYREFPIALRSNLIPDSLILIIASGLGTGQVGTELIVDELAFTTGTSSVSLKELLPGSFSLHQNYPNPFNPTTAISYQLSAVSKIKLVIYDLLGREIAVLVDETKAPGSYAVTFDGAGLASGVYLYRMQAGSFTETKRLLLLR
jgi:hypothetical protein